MDEIGVTITGMKSTLAVMSVMMLTAMISSAALVHNESAPVQVTSFIGTTPNATDTEVQAPTF